MTILEDENIILNDDSFIINSIKEWFAFNVVSIYLYNTYNDNNLKCDIFDNFNFKPLDFDSYQEFQNAKFKYISNLKNETFSKFIQINADVYPAHVKINGDIHIFMLNFRIPTDLFVLEEINGDLTMEYRDIDSLDGLPSRENIKGDVRRFRRL